MLKFFVWLAIFSVILTPYIARNSYAEIAKSWSASKIDTTGYQSNMRINIEADELSIFRLDGKAILKGNVKMQQGTLSIISSDVIAYMHQAKDEEKQRDKTTKQETEVEAKGEDAKLQQIKKIVASGTKDKQVEIMLNNSKSFSNKATYLPRDSMFIIEGGVNLYNDRSHLQGELLIYDLKNQYYKLTGSNTEELQGGGKNSKNSSKKGRVRGYFNMDD